jgi:uncharacterized protein
VKLLFDLGHPAHFHLFKYSIRELQASGHQVIITAKDQPILISLLHDAEMDYINLGQKGHSLTGKAFRQFWFDWKILRIARKNKIDYGIGISMSITHAALFSKMKSLLFDDDDYAVTPLFYRFAHRFAHRVISPDCLAWQKGGKKYSYYKGYHELAYLHPKRFIPDPSVPAKLGIKRGESFFVLRFNSFKAYHDPGHTGLSSFQKEILIEKLSSYGRVLISGENTLSNHYQPYKINLNPCEMHSLMAFATMFIGDSQTMTSEAAVLGIPSFRLNSYAGKISYLEEQEKKYLLTFAYHPKDFNEMLGKMEELLGRPNLREEWQNRREQMLLEKMDVTAFVVWFIENYPASAIIMRENPEYQERFNDKRKMKSQ